MEKLSPMDNIYLIENKDYIGNVVGTFVCSKFDAEKMKDFLYENWCMKLPRARAKLVTIFGRQYFVQMNKSEMDHKYKWGEIITRIDHIKTRGHLLNFLQWCQEKPLNLYENVPYRWYISENYEGDKSLLVYVMNHGYQDGISLLGSMNAMSKDAFKKPVA